MPEWFEVKIDRTFMPDHLWIPLDFHFHGRNGTRCFMWNSGVPACLFPRWEQQSRFLSACTIMYQQYMWCGSPLLFLCYAHTPQYKSEWKGSKNAGNTDQCPGWLCSSLMLKRHAVSRWPALGWQRGCAFISSANIALDDKHIISYSSDKDAPEHD